MRNKYISTQSNELLSYFSEQDRVCFDYAEAFTALPESRESAVKELLSDMTKRGLLMRLREGVYYIIPYQRLQSPTKRGTGLPFISSVCFTEK